MPINSDSDVTFIYSLRFIVNSLEDCERFKEQYPQYNASSRQFFKDKTKYVVAIGLEDNVDMEPIKKYLDSYNGKLNHDFFISVATCNDSEIVEVPSFVVECIRYIGGKLTFSFTSIG